MPRDPTLQGTSLNILSLRGGMNDTDPPNALSDDQCTLAQNVEFFYSMLGERRAGCGPLVITSSDLDDEAVIVHISQWFPSNQIVVPEVFAIGATAGVSTTVAYRNTSAVWAEITTIDDALNTTSPDVYGITTQSLHGVLFVSYHSAVDRMHVWDDTNLRRSGMAQPAAAPTGADHGAGAFTGTRYYRVRFITKSGAAILNQSEPSLVLTFAPSGGGDGITVTKPPTVSEHETHWVLEASTDKKLFFLLATTVVGTTTFLDTTVFATGYSDGALSDAIGAYGLQPSAKFLAVDGDRLIGGGHWTDKTKMSDVWWSPVQADPGVGNPERLPIVTTGGTPITTTKTLDNYDGGPLTGLAAATFGVWYAFKNSAIYQANRTSDVISAYDMITVSKTIGAIPGSIVKAVDASGATWIYFLDPNEGPYRIGPGGLQRIVGLRITWGRINLQAANVIACSCYYAYKQQVHWWIAVDGNDSPNMKLVLQVSELRQIGENIGRGWSVVQSGDRIAQAYCATILTETVSIGGITSISNRPFIGLTAPDLIQRCDTLTTDAGIAYAAKIVTKPYIANGLLDKFGAMNASLLATQNATSAPVLRFIRDMGVETSAAVTANLTQVGAETLVLVDFDAFVMSGSRLLQVQISDT